MALLQIKLKIKRYRAIKHFVSSIYSLTYYAFLGHASSKIILFPYMKKKKPSDKYQWIIGPKQAAVKLKNSLIWSIVDPPKKKDGVQLGLAMSLSRSDHELEEDTASCNSVIRHPFSLSKCPGWLILFMWISIAVSAVLIVVGLSKYHIKVLQLPAGLIQNWRDFFFLSVTALAGYALSVYAQAMILISSCKDRNHLFGVGRLTVKVEPVIWRLGIPPGSALMALSLPFFCGLASWSWLPANHIVFPGLAIGCWIYVIVVLFPMRPGVGTLLLEWLLNVEDIPQQLRWAISSRFLPFGQTINTGSGVSMAWAAASLGVWVALAGALFTLLSSRPQSGLSMPGLVWSGLASAAGIAFIVWLVIEIIRLCRMAYLLRGRKKLKLLDPSPGDIEKLHKNLSLIKFLPELSKSSWQWHTAPAGTFLIRYGERDRIFFWIASGEAKVLGRSHSGDVINLATLYGHTGMGEISFLYDQPRNADILITKTALVASLTYEQFSTVIKGALSDRFRELVLAGQAFDQSQTFLGIPNKDKERWIQKGDPSRYKAGETIIHSGKMERWMGLVVAGEVEVIQQEQKVGVLNVGDVLGEIAFLDGRPRTATLRALKDVIMWRWEPDWLSSEVSRVGLRSLLEKISRKRQN
jgi:CRP-like cAMP-binding protein